MPTPWQVWLYAAAILCPLTAFLIQFIFLRQFRRLNAYIATLAIATSFVLSLIGFASALPAMLQGHHAEAEHAAAGNTSADPHADHADSEHASTDAAHPPQSHNGSHAKPHQPPFEWRWDFNWVAHGGNIPLKADAIAASTRPALAIPLGIAIDPLAVLMFLMVSLIATLIHVYSIGYMADDSRFPLFFSYLSLFCFSMLGLVASPNAFQIFMFWELVGVCSYLLIGFWYEDKKNADAANKAFIVNRVGDVGMLVGLGILWTTFGTFDFRTINNALADPALRNERHEITRTSAGIDVTVNIPDMSAGAASTAPAATQKTFPYWILIVAGLGIFAGCVGKSAQFPLHVWLPDAMAGPTPVSALIHAATMVAAGVYLVGRFFPLFTFEVMLTIAYCGAITLFIAATIAVVQTDYKKVLAYSTVSQLGFMMLGLGVGGWAAGLFHLLTHAFFKALLFLGAGSVYHSVHTYEMPALGGLYRKMPITAKTMLVGTLAIAGVPLFSGFYSKDAILGNALRFAQDHPAHFLLFLTPVVGAFITAFYMFRMWFLLFDGESRSAHLALAEDRHAHDPGHGKAHGHDHGHDDHSHSHAHGHGHGGDPVAHAHESPRVMTIPLIVLAFFALVVGYPITLIPIGNIEPVLEGMLATAETVPVLPLGMAKWIAMGASILIAAGGIGLAAAFYSRKKFLSADKVAQALPGVHRFLSGKWFFDEAYQATLVKPTLALARAVAWFDKRFIDGVVNGSALITVVLSKFDGFFDKFAVDGLVNLVGWSSLFVGDRSRRIQTGRLRNYLAFLAFAVVGLFIGVFLWVRK
jgi:proton-translocating NADH-quinone oxidoreductase chain L